MIHAPYSLKEYLEGLTVARLKQALKSLPFETLLELNRVVSTVVEDVYVEIQSGTPHRPPTVNYREPVREGINTRTGSKSGHTEPKN